MEHKLKILSRHYAAILQGKKTFEVRKDDRPFQEGDTLLLEECVTPDGCGYTGREMKVEVTYILRDSEYVKDGYCIMGIKIISTNKSRYYNNTPQDKIKKLKAANVQPIIETENMAIASDEFICKKCGIYLKDYIKVVMDEDDNGCIDEQHYEYEPKFCPECGAKVESCIKIPKRDKPLYTMDEICKMNGVEYYPR